MSYRPKESYEMKTAAKIYKSKKEYINGVPKITYIPINDPIIMCNFKTYGGTETQKNDLLVVIDTAKVVTWFRPDITSDCIIEILQTGKFYQIKNEPENLEMKNQFLLFSVERINPNV